MLELADDRVKGAVGVMGRALVPNRDVRVFGNGVFQHLADTRLADAGLAAEQGDLALAVLGPLPQTEQFLSSRCRPTNCVSLPVRMASNRLSTARSPITR